MDFPNNFAWAGIAVERGIGRFHFPITSLPSPQDLSETIESFNAFNNLSIDDKFEMLIKLIHISYIIDFKVECKNVSTKKLTSSWMTDDTKNILNEKHRLYRLSISMPQ